MPLSDLWTERIELTGLQMQDRLLLLLVEAADTIFTWLNDLLLRSASAFCWAEKAAASLADSVSRCRSSCSMEIMRAKILAYMQLFLALSLGPQ